MPISSSVVVTPMNELQNEVQFDGKISHGHQKSMTPTFFLTLDSSIFQTQQLNRQPSQSSELAGQVLETTV